MKKCKICEEDSRKRNVCGNCKTKYPYLPSGNGAKPFNRFDLYLKDLKR